VRSQVIHQAISEDDWFDVEQGVREGSKISPILFAVAFADLPDALRACLTPAELEEVRFGTAEAFSPQSADDVALVAGSPTTLKKLMEAFGDYCTRRCAQINYGKTKVVQFYRHPMTAILPFQVCAEECGEDGTVPIVLFNITDPHTGLTHGIEVVRDFCHLGVEFDEDLTFAAAFRALRARFWAAHHQGERMGMHRQGLHISQRIRVWKVFVLPILHTRLLFLTKAQAARIQTDVNRSLRRIAAEYSCTQSLCLEFGIPPVEAMRLRGLANLFGRLETASPHLLSTQLHNSLYRAHGPTLPMIKACREALNTLGLSEHIGGLDVFALGPPQRAQDQQLQDDPAPQQSPLLPYRHNWHLAVKNSVLAWVDKETRRWLQDEERRGTEYASDALWEEEHPLKPGKEADWLSMSLPAKTANTIMLLRSQATHLARHADARKLHRSKLITRDNCFCPLCLDGSKQEHLEDTRHLLFHCPFLEEHRRHLQESARTYTVAHFLMDKQGRAYGWSDLSEDAQHKLLLANVPSRRHFHHAESLEGEIPLRVFVQGLVTATTPHVHTMLKVRTTIAEAQVRGATGGSESEEG